MLVCWGGSVRYRSAFEVLPFVAVSAVWSLTLLVAPASLWPASSELQSQSGWQQAVQALSVRHL